jgi:hypothetical protein
MGLHRGGQCADVSVLFAELLGLEEFSSHVGETKALEVLGDVIAAFDLLQAA